MTAIYRVLAGAPFRYLCTLMVLTAAGLAGCAKTYHFNTRDYVPVYPRLEAPVNLRAALVVPYETKDFAYKFVYKRWGLGEALESHMLSGLKAAFTEVAVASDGKIPAGVDRIVTCSLGNKTDLYVGFVQSDKKATIELACRVTNASGTPLWEGSVVRTETFNAGIVGHMLQLTALASVFVKSVDVGSAEDMYDAMITSGSNNSLILTVDEMMNKMIGEGAPKICPGCTTKPDWRNVVKTKIEVSADKDD